MSWCFEHLAQGERLGGAHRGGWVARIAAAALAGVLAGCGGAGGSADATGAAPGAQRHDALAVTADPGEPGRTGAFSIDHRTANIESGGTPISLAHLNDHIAGAKGFLRNAGGKLFAGPDRIRLYGIVLFGGATMPAKPDAVKVAARLRKEGFNAVRLFGWDNNLAVRDTWTVTYRAQGMLRADETLDPVALDHFDHFVYQLQQQGLYVMLPLHTNHRQREAPDCIDWCEGLQRFMPVLIDSTKRLAASLLNHRNPYTGKAYKDDPGVFAVEIGNEDSMVHRWANGTLDRYVGDPVLYTKYGSVLESKWRAWLQARYATPAAAGAAWGESLADWPAATVPTWAARTAIAQTKFRDWIEFISDIDTGYSDLMYDWLKNTVGVKSLVLSGQGHYLMMHSRRRSTDLADFHSYFGSKGTATGEINPANGAPVFQVQNRSLLSWPSPHATGPFGASQYKDLTRPNVMTEYASRMGNQYMAEAEPVVGAYAGFQDMDAIFLTDAHQMNLFTEPHYYTGWYNVGVSAVARVATALAYRRGDMKPGAPHVLRQTTASILDTAAKLRHWNPANFHFGGNIRAPMVANTYQQVVDSTAEESIITLGQPVGTTYTTTTGELKWTTLDRITVDTPRTKTAIGYFRDTDVDLGSGIAVRVGATMNNYAVVQVTTLDDQAVLPSSAMLLALTGHFTVPGEYPRAPGQDTYSWGTGLPRIEAVPAKVRITTPKDLVVWALDPTGARRAAVPVVRVDAALEFVVGPAFDTGWYLIEEPGATANRRPTVALAAPASVSAGTAVALSAIASDPDGSIAKVDFFAGGVLIGTDDTAPYSVSWTPATGGDHALTARATDNAGATTTSTVVAVSAGSALSEIGGLLGRYFDNVSLAGVPVLTRVEPVDFTWAGDAVPAAGLVDRWSVQWTGHVVWPTSGRYTLQLIADDGIRVWLDGVLVLDRWANSGNLTANLAPANVTAGTRASIVIEHYDGTGASTVRLRWQRPETGIYFERIPGSALSPY